MPTPADYETLHDAICDAIEGALDIGDQITTAQLLSVRQDVLVKWDAAKERQRA